MTTDTLITKEKRNSYAFNEGITISLAEYAFYQSLEKQFKEVRNMQREVDDAMNSGKAYTNADDFINDLLANDENRS